MSFIATFFRVTKSAVGLVAIISVSAHSFCYADNFGPKKRTPDAVKTSPSGSVAGSSNSSESVKGFFNSLGGFLQNTLIVAGAAAQAYSNAQSSQASSSQYSSAGPSYDEYVQTCKVKYHAEYGWSEYYTVEVRFVSGQKLNQATRTFDYKGFSTYAVIFWGPGQASVIEITSPLACGQNVTQSCITGSAFNLEGEDQRSKDWEICTKNICF